MLLTKRPGVKSTGEYKFTVNSKKETTDKIEVPGHAVSNVWLTRV